MKKKLLTLGALALTMTSINAQVLTYVGVKGQVYVNEKALVASYGGVKTVGDGLIDNSGNIMVVGGSADKFATVTASGADKTDGGNIILRMTNDAIGSLRYGQLYIDGLTQGNITGIVDKQFKDVKHGDYQQIALPFYGKVLDDLSNDFSSNFSDRRWSKNEILVWDNTNVVFDVKSVSSKTTNGTAYYAVGTTNFDAQSGVKTVKGVPFANGITETLVGAGATVNFGANGNGRNKYREAYNTYLQDAWAVGFGETWVGDYGKNIYQFGNPFLTNLDLGILASTDFIDDIIGIRVEPVNVTATENAGAYEEGFVTQSSDYKYINYDNAGKAIGDVNAIVRPMQTFVVKTLGDTKAIDFDVLRRFAYEPQTKVDATVTTGLQTASVNRANSTLLNSRSRSAVTRTLSSASSYVLKQLGVIALDEKGREIGRTYYFVSPNAITGAEFSERKRQATASPNNIIGTFEENKEGGYDVEAAKNYWLYINEANENDFKGKEVRMKLYSNKIKSLKFEIREDAKLIADNTSLSNGESFYIQAENGTAVEIKQGAVIAANTDTFGLFYGKPDVKVQKVEEPVAVPEVNREKTDLVFDTNTGEYKLLFASDWKTARVTIFNARGKVVVPAQEVNAKSDYTVTLPNAIGTYIVRALNEKGEVFSKKVLKN